MCVFVCVSVCLCVQGFVCESQHIRVNILHTSSLNSNPPSSPSSGVSYTLSLRDKLPYIKLVHKWGPEGIKQMINPLNPCVF